MTPAMRRAVCSIEATPAAFPSRRCKLVALDRLANPQVIEVGRQHHILFTQLRIGAPQERHDVRRRQRVFFDRDIGLQPGVQREVRQRRAWSARSRSAAKL